MASLVALFIEAVPEPRPRASFPEAPRHIPRDEHRGSKWREEVDRRPIGERVRVSRELAQVI